MSLDQISRGTTDPLDTVLAVHEALDRLGEVDRRLHRVVELRYFGGLGLQEIGQVLGLSVATVHGAWELARAWLARAIAS